jgi:tetratricopeptide (TPR) repeat protein
MRRDVMRHEVRRRLATAIVCVTIALLCCVAAAAAQDWVALRREASTAAAAKEYTRAVELFKRAIAAGATSPDAFYDAASAAALAGDRNQAFAWIGEATARGYRDVEPMRADTSLASLHDDARWAAALAAAQKNFDAYVKTVDAELFDIFQRDQADRAVPIEEIDWQTVSKRDAGRRERVRKLVAEGRAKASDDYLHAAFVMQHGERPEDYLAARDWAKKAAELDPKNRTALWLSAAAEDRYLWSVRKPQIYGTQFTKPQGGRWTIDPIDEKAVTDDERRRLGVPTIAETRARLAAMNAGDKEGEQ